MASATRPPWSEEPDPRHPYLDALGRDPFDDAARRRYLQFLLSIPEKRDHVLTVASVESYPRVDEETEEHEGSSGHHDGGESRSR